MASRTMHGALPSTRNPHRRGDVEINKSRLTPTLLALWDSSGYAVPADAESLPHPRHLVAAQVRIAGGKDDRCRARTVALECREAARAHEGRSRGPAEKASTTSFPNISLCCWSKTATRCSAMRSFRRAHNLAWNRVTAFDVTDEIDGMNAVVEDPAVRSPMDAVACLVFQRSPPPVLAGALSQEGNTGVISREMESELDLAIDLAPIGSNANARALRRAPSSSRRNAAPASRMPSSPWTRR